jgi:hypothetical protein
MSDLMTTTEAFGHDIDLFNEIKEIGWVNTPFLSSLKDMAPRARTNPSFGHKWMFMDVPDGDENAQLEGSPSVPVEKFALGNATNHYQIFKNSFGVSESENVATGIDDKKELARQMDMSRIKHMKSMEMALLSDTAPVQRVNTATPVAGKLGGIKHFLTASTDNGMQAATLTWKHIRELLKIGFLKGIPYTHIMMNDVQKDALDDILFSKTTNMNMANSKIDNNVTIIGNTPYGNNIKVTLNPFLADDEIIAYNPEYVNTVIWRPTKVKDVSKDVDGTVKEIITELTLRVEHEFALSRLKNLAV